MESPTARTHAAGNQSTPLPPHGICCPRGVNKSAGWNQPQSRAVSPVNFVTDFVPGGVLELVGQSLATESYQGRKFSGFALFFFQHDPQALLGQRAEGCLFLACNALGALEKIISDFNGCLHNMATHIRMDGCPYQEVFLACARHRASRKSARSIRSNHRTSRA